LGWSCPIQGAQTSAVCVTDPSSALIFVGTLTELTSDDNPTWSKATFQVTEPLRAEKLEVVQALMMNRLCGDGAPPRVGGSYLVLTQQGPGGEIGPLLRCEQLRPADEIAPELEYLRSAEFGETPTQLSGETTVEVQERQVVRKIPLPGTKIELTAEKRRIEFVSDEDGRFGGSLKPGKYTVSVTLPAGYNRKDYGLGSVITLTEHRCTQLTVEASPAGSITAHIVDVGGKDVGSMLNIELILETAEDQQFVNVAVPDQDGNVVIKDLPPGEYLLGLNTYLRLSRSSPDYPPTYYPGVSKRSDSQVIQLALGERKVLPEMRIMKGQGCEIPVLVSEASGKPSVGTDVALAYPDYPFFTSVSGDETDEKGKTTVHAVFPGPVLLRADKKRDDHSLDQSEVAEIKACPAEPILLKLTKIVTLPDAPDKH
jgi:hypothetical protein